MKLVLDKVAADVDLHSIAASIIFQHTIMIATKNTIFTQSVCEKQLRSYEIGKLTRSMATGNEQRATQ